MVGWKDLHREKILGQSDKDVLKKQLEEANKEDIPVPLVYERDKKIERKLDTLSGLLKKEIVI